MSGSPGEFEWEPVPGLPEELPAGEHILWQGSPSPRSLVRHAFHVRGLAIYFALMLVARIALAVAEGESVGSALSSSAGLAGLAMACLALVAGVAWLNARATVYTITNRRVVMRIGVAVVVALNLPHRRIESAGLRLYPDATGDVPLGLEGSAELGFALLWPHARPWRFGDRAQPMLRSVPDAESVAEILTAGLASTLRAPMPEASVRALGDRKVAAPAREPRTPEAAAAAS